MGDARHSFLATASQQLFESSPTTSAHLSAENVNLQRVHQRFRGLGGCCRSCGTLAIPGVTSSLVTSRISGEPGPKRRMKQKSFTSRSTTIQQCLACGRHTKETITKPNKSVRAISTTVVPPLQAPAQPPPAASVPDSPGEGSKPPSTEPKVSSKKRAKARKDREGLQALLNKAKPSAGPSKLNFMDMMKR